MGDIQSMGTVAKVPLSEGAEVVALAVKHHDGERRSVDHRLKGLVGFDQQAFLAVAGGLLTKVEHRANRSADKDGREENEDSPIVGILQKQHDRQRNDQGCRCHRITEPCRARRERHSLTPNGSTKRDFELTLAVRL